MRDGRTYHILRLLLAIVVFSIFGYMLYQGFMEFERKQQQRVFSQNL